MMRRRRRSCGDALACWTCMMVSLPLLYHPALSCRISVEQTYLTYLMHMAWHIRDLGFGRVTSLIAQSWSSREPHCFSSRSLGNLKSPPTCHYNRKVKSTLTSAINLAHRCTNFYMHPPPCAPR